MNVLDFDELNILAPRLEALQANSADGKIPKDEAEDIVEDILLMSYALGYGENPNADKMRDAVWKTIAGKTFSDRVREYAESGDIDGIKLVADVDSHRVFNAGSYQKALDSGKTEKQWVCVFRNSRDTHMYLHGTKIPMDAEFYSYMGGKALYPGAFGIAEEDCNCQCYLVYS